MSSLYLVRKGEQRLLLDAHGLSQYAAAAGGEFRVETLEAEAGPLPRSGLLLGEAELWKLVGIRPPEPN